MAWLAVLARSDGILGLASVGGEGSAAQPLTLVAAVLGVIALVSLRRVVRTRREARSFARTARREAEAVQQWLRSIRQTPGGAPRALWQFDPRTGEQRWSPGLRQMFGIDHTDLLMPGDGETLLCAHGIDLVRQVTQGAARRTPYALEYDLGGAAARPRRIRVEVCNLFGSDGEPVRVVAAMREQANHPVYPA